MKKTIHIYESIFRNDRPSQITLALCGNTKWPALGHGWIALESILWLFEEDQKCRYEICVECSKVKIVKDRLIELELLR